MLRALVLLALALAPGACGRLHPSSGPGPGHGFRRYYLTADAVPGANAREACARGYHMASRFELLDVSRMEYDLEHGLTTDDSGFGPPSRAVQPDPPGGTGWIRTGGAAQYTPAAATGADAATNCAAWSSSSPQASGTVAWLVDRFVPAHDPAAVWAGGPATCDLPHRVWCVEDDDVPEPFFRPGRRGRQRRDD